MFRLVVCSALTVLFVAAPNVAGNFADPNAVEKRLQQENPTCLPTLPAHVKPVPPEVHASASETVSYYCSLDTLKGVVSVHRFSYTEQKPGLEAVNSKHRFVSKQDRNRFGSKTVKLPWGNVRQNFFIDGNSGKLAATWHWYELANKTYASPSQVKIREFLAALMFMPEAPEVYVAQWLPADEIEPRLSEAETADLARIVGEAAGYIGR